MVRGSIIAAIDPIRRRAVRLAGGGTGNTGFDRFDQLNDKPSGSGTRTPIPALEACIGVYSILLSPDERYLYLTDVRVHAIARIAMPDFFDFRLF